MKKILILANHAVGLLNFRSELLQELDNEKYEVHISVPSHKAFEMVKDKKYVIHDTNVDRRGINPVKDFRLLLNYIRLIKKIKPDTVLLYTIKPNIYGGLACRILKVKYISTITGLGTSMQSTSKLANVLKQLYKISLKKANTVVFQNLGNRDFFVESSIVDIESTMLVPGSGVNIEKYKELDINFEGDAIFTFIGRVMKDKGIDEFLSAATKLKRENSNLRFQIIGFFESDEYKKKVNDLLELNIIEYLGESSDTRTEMSKTQCIVLPSYHEGMSNVLLEGAASGLPLITTDINGCKESVDEGYNGYLVNKADEVELYNAMKKFSELSKSEKELMGKNSLAKMKNEFDRSIVVSKYMDKIKR
ncbi:MAG: glycosyltransferase family 4 protein [Acidaminobacteraceae bacterium]